jgi:iron complex transport system substrate-binding protein
MPGRCCRSEAGAIPALSRNCDAPTGDEPGRLRCAEQAALVGRAVSTAPAGKPFLFRVRKEEVSVSSFTVLRSFAIPLAVAFTVACGTTTVATPTVTDSFPLTLTTPKGPVTLAHQPKRIVSLSATGTEDLFAVGAGKQVVAVDSYSTYPAEAPRTSLSAFTPNIEAIAGYQPDMVLVADDTGNVFEQLTKLQIPVLTEPASADLNGVYAEIKQIAQATGHSAQAASVVSGIQQQVKTILALVHAPTKPLKVYHELDQTYYSATSHTFIGQMYKLLGLQNIADSAPAGNDYPQLSAEYIISSNPDLIVLADTVCCGQSMTTVAARPGWSAISAVRTRSVVPVDDSIASQWGPRIVLFLKAIADALKALEGSTA